MECPTDPIAGIVFSGTDTSPVTGTAVPFQAAAADYFAIVALNSNVSQLGFSPRQDETYTSANNSELRLPGASSRTTRSRSWRTSATAQSNTMMLAEMSGRPKAYLTGGFLNTSVADKTYGYGAGRTTTSTSLALTPSTG